MLGFARPSEANRRRADDADPHAHHAWNHSGDGGTDRLRDIESLPRMSELRDLLRAGASSLPVGIEEDEEALLPWISIYEVDEFEKKLKALSDSQAAP